MASRNYLVNQEDLTLAEKREYKLRALAAGLERCTTPGVGIGNVEADIPGLEAIPKAQVRQRVNLIKGFISTGDWPRSVDQRELVTGPARTDFTAATATALDAMFTAALALVGAQYSCFQAVPAPQLLVNRLVVFYGVSLEAVAVVPPIPVSHLLFRIGGVAGNVEALFDLQAQNTRLAIDCFFTEPVVIDPQQVFAAQVICRVATGAAYQMHLHNFLFGPVGQTIL